MTEQITNGNKLIKVMPDQETLEEFVRGFHGGVRVSFDRERGEFVWIVPRPPTKLVSPAAETELP